ncbi:ExbD/TolR family protein [Actibacterium ureilyticum]|uniref:ExbD/TolR family protein n=1 Tax=Actibacterium ureilyticum TaxID=1590614 RepID=UPI000BAB22DA|nr:biopolymer transporter ExbD [Actibacterium ureilyticum]
MARHVRHKRVSEPTIALINIVFLMLIFFLIAGSIAPPLQPDLTLVSTRDLAGREPPDALVIAADGRSLYRGAEITPEAFLEQVADGSEAPEIRIVPDRDLPAAQLLKIGRALQQAGAAKLFVVTERGLE